MEQLGEFKQKYDDCVSRLYRLLEMLMLKEIENNFQVSASEFPYKLDEDLKKKYENQKTKECKA